MADVNRPGQLLHRQRDHDRPVAALPALHRPAGAGEQVDQEVRAGAQELHDREAHGHQGFLFTTVRSLKNVSTILKIKDHSKVHLNL